MDFGKWFCVVCFIVFVVVTFYFLFLEVGEDIDFFICIIKVY